MTVIAIQINYVSRFCKITAVINLLLHNLECLIYGLSNVAQFNISVFMCNIVILTFNNFLCMFNMSLFMCNFFIFIFDNLYVCSLFVYLYAIFLYSYSILVYLCQILLYSVYMFNDFYVCTAFLYLRFIHF